MVKCRTAFHIVPFMKTVREKPYHIISLILNKTFWKCNDKLSSFNTFPCCSACLKIQLIFSRKIFPELQCCSFCLIGRIEMFLSFRIGNIINSFRHIRQLVVSDKWMSAYKHSPFPALACFAVSRCIGTCLRTYPPFGGCSLQGRNTQSINEVCAMGVFCSQIRFKHFHRRRSQTRVQRISRNNR